MTVLTHRIVNGTHSNATSSFIRACMAFCYITIPSLEHPLHKLQLYVLCAQTAYLNQSLSQGLKIFIKKKTKNKKNTILLDGPE